MKVKVKKWYPCGKQREKLIQVIVYLELETVDWMRHPRISMAHVILKRQAKFPIDTVGHTKRCRF